jgi:Kef-type K+ transport system membrane component KefB
VAPWCSLELLARSLAAEHDPNERGDGVSVDLIRQDPFVLTAAVLAVAAVVGLLANRLRQPLIVAFIAVGIVVGPAVLGWVGDSEPLELLAEIGIAVLLFLVGLKLDLHLVRTTGPVALITGLGQVIFTSVVGYFIAIALGMSPVTAIYVAVALTFSSTIIIVKLLSDKRELEELHGRIAIGFLIVQDIVVVLVMIGLSAFGVEREGSLAVEIFLVFLRGLGFLLAVGAMMKWVLPRVLHHMARSSELLLVFAIAWAVTVAAVSDVLGFSTEVGAFLAGFALASTPYREAIGSRLAPLRDFLLLFFFIELGSKLDFSEIGGQVPAALILSAFVLIGNPLIVLIIMGFMGYARRVGFLAGLTVAQISEFSLIMVALGLQLGHIQNETLGLVTLVGLITIGLSTYLILYSHPIYVRLAPYLAIFERKRLRPQVAPSEEHTDVIVYGSGRFGRHLIGHLADAGYRVLVVDWDPYADTVDPRVQTVYGDAEDADFPGTLPLAQARWVVSTIPRQDTNRILVEALRRLQFAGQIAVTAHSDLDVEQLADLDGVAKVLQPFKDAADMGASRLLARLDLDES